MIKSQAMTKSQGGFTLIELVVVIVILGILAAFAVPRFMGMEGRARVATLNGLAGSLRAGYTMGHAAWLADGQNAASVTIEGTPMAFTNGYPNRTNADRLIQDLSGFTYTPANGQFRKVGAPTPANCRITYTNAAAGATPTVTLVTTGCGL
jgi:MSHA pilin protein MshA